MTSEIKYSVLKVLDYTKSNKKWFDEKNFIAGYHTVTIQGEKVLGQRDPEKRLSKIDYDFNGKRVIDVGCSNGGLLHALSNRISYGVGVDFNSKCINAANALKAVNQTDNIHFFTFDLDKEDQSLLRHLILGESVDVCFFFNISLWVKRWKEAFTLCSGITTTLFFEAHGNEEQQKEQMLFVRSIYQNVDILSEQSDDDPTYAKRKMYRCEKRKEINAVPSFSESFEFLEVIDEDKIKDVYEQAIPGHKVESVYVFPNTHESIVADINGEYIIKFPRRKRGSSGLLSEQKVTEYMRERLGVDIPGLSLHADPILFGLYKKHPGFTFDKSRYAELSEMNKEGIAAQLAEVFKSFHAVPKKEVERAELPLSPSWELSPEIIEEQLSSEEEQVIKVLVPEVVRNHRNILVADSNRVFGHFDMHGGNILVDGSHTKITAVLDFGNCKIGDLHQDLSSVNLSSPDLACRIINKYEEITKRKVNRLLIQHYTTMFYLHLLAGLRKKKADNKYAYWLGELREWFNFLLRDRADKKLKVHKPVSSIPEGWRRWVASNLMKGTASDGLQNVLMKQGFSAIDSATESLLAERHPYIQAGKEIFHTLNKRNWLLKTLNALASLDSRYSSGVSKIKTPRYQTFIDQYYSKNIPVVLSGGVDHWPALKKWSPEYLLDHYGEKEIEVQIDREKDKLYERNSHKLKKKLLMREFVALINQGESNNYYMTANNTKNSLNSISSLFKDIADFGEGYRDQVSNELSSFFWFGPKGTFTPIHHDLTNNMLVQIYGRKKITLIPALQVPLLYNDKGVFSAADYPNSDFGRHPLMKNITPIEVVLQPGESLFIPIAWWHCVEGLDTSISLSFTNFLAPNSYSADFPKG